MVKEDFLRTLSAHAINMWSAGEVSRAVTIGMVPEAVQSDYQAPITRGEFCSLLVGMIRAYDGSLFQELTVAAPTFLDTDEEAVRLCAVGGIVEGEPFP